MTDWRELRKRIGIVAASVGQQMHDEDTALDIVVGGEQAMIGTWGRRDLRVDQRARKMMEEFGIHELTERRWEVLSQGERQRVLIARAMMTRPRLLILDEPCAGLDPVARRRFLQMVEALTKKHRGPSVVLVTHHVEEITPAFSHALLIRSGEVFVSGPVRKAITSANLSQVFDASLSVRRRGDGYVLVDSPSAEEI
jgi:iron complex transport system ATP-binding protein